MPESSESIESQFGLDDAQKGGWSNTEWLHYRLSGLTPEDTRALDDGTLSQREKEALQSQIDAAQEISKGKTSKGDAEPESQEKFVFDNAFCSRFKEVADLSRKINPLETEEARRLLDEQRDGLAVLDKLALQTSGFSKNRGDQSFGELMESFRQSAESLVSVFHEVNDPGIKFRSLRNLNAIKNALWMDELYQKFTDLVGETIASQDLETLSEILIGDDYFLAINTFDFMRGVFHDKVEGLPYFNDFSFSKYSSSAAPREVVISYGSRLLPAVIFQSQRVMRNQGLENADDYVPFIGGLVGRIMNDPGILTELTEGGLDLQSLADLFSAGVDESTRERVSTPAIVVGRTF